MSSATLKGPLVLTLLLAFFVSQAPGRSSAPAAIPGPQAVNDAFHLSHSQLANLVLPARVRGPLTVRVAHGGVELELVLAPYSVRAPGYRVVVHGSGGTVEDVAPGPVLTRRGFVRGIPGSRVAASVGEGLTARVDLGAGEGSHEILFIEPVAALIAGAPQALHVIYRAGDVIADGSMRCGVHASAGAAGSTGRTPPEPLTRKAGSCPQFVCELACETDFEYFQAKGSVANVEAAINTIINLMNTQYETQVNITHKIVLINVWTTSADPYSSTNNSDTALNEFTSYWNQNMGGVQRDDAHMFSGKSWSGGVVGIAWLAGICNSSGYSVVRNVGGAACRTDLSAHELGHNWRADHCSCSTHTMNPFLTCANNFSAASINVITKFAAGRVCLDCPGNPGNPICQTDIGFGGPGAAVLSLCGDDLATGKSADLLLTGAAPGQPVFLMFGSVFQPTPFRGGTLVAFPGILFGPLPLDGNGELLLSGIPGGGGPSTLFLQAFYVDGAQPFGVGISNALGVQLLQ